jgi:transposase
LKTRSPTRATTPIAFEPPLQTRALRSSFHRSVPARSQAIPCDKDLYKERNLVERFINKIKHYRRIATRYEKTVVSFAAVLFLVATMSWLK